MKFISYIYTLTFWFIEVWMQWFPCKGNVTPLLYTRPIAFILRWLSEWELSQDSVACLNRALPIKLKCFSEQKLKKNKSLDRITLTHFPKVWHSSIKYKDIRQNQWTMKYRSQWLTFIFRSNIGSYWLIIPKYGVHISNSLQDIRQNHWTMKYRSQWPTIILRSNIKSYCLIIPKYGGHISNSLQDIRQNH